MSKHYSTGQQIGLKLCNELGIDPTHVVSIDLHCTVGDIARVTVVENVFADDELTSVVRGYELRDMDT